MQELWWQLQDVDSFTVWIALGFAISVCLFIHEIVGSPTLAWLSAPFLAAGGAAAPTLLARQMITLSYDATVNEVSAVAMGTLSMLMLILAANWLWALFVEYNVKRTKLVAVPARPPRIRR
jgi:hypothetical protein